MTALRAMWAAPWSITSHALAWAWCAVGWGRGVVIGGTRVVRAHGPVARWFARRGWTGVAIGVHVWVWVAPTERLVAHEAEHIRQWSRWGPLFPAVYLALLARYGYAGHPLERAARIAAGEAFAADGAPCSSPSASP